MSAIRLSRRGLFGGFAALLAAPAIVRVASIMPVAAKPPIITGWQPRYVNPTFAAKIGRPLTVDEWSPPPGMARKLIDMGQPLWRDPPEDAFTRHFAKLRQELAA